MKIKIKPSKNVENSQDFDAINILKIRTLLQKLSRIVGKYWINLVDSSTSGDE